MQGCRFAGQCTPPAYVAECTAQAIRAHHSERGPAKSWGSPAAGAAMQMASEAVPVARKPAFSTAWVLASVTVMTALT